MVVRRTAKKLPSLTRNMLRALLVLALVPVVIYATYALTGNPSDAIATGEVNIDPVPLPPAADSLNGTSEALPDLLEGDVPENVNPTEILDALGNPVAKEPNSELVGGNTAETPGTLLPQRSVSGPKTILIDGKPLGQDTPFAASPLPRAPIAGLTRLSPYGPVPSKSSSGKAVVDAYARPFTATAGKNQVSLVIGGLGIDTNITRRIISETPPEVTLSFAAHANGLQSWVDQARAFGHEVLIELPMESQNFNAGDPGETYTLRTSGDPAKNIRSLDYLMSKAQGYFGVTNYNGDVLLQRADALSPILAHLSNAGVGFVFDGSASAASLPALAQSADVPFTAGYNLLDLETSPLSIQAELDRLTKQARAGFSPIGVGFAYPQTLEAVKAWAQTLDEKGLELAPASSKLSK